MRARLGLILSFLTTATAASAAELPVWKSTAADAPKSDDRGFATCLSTYLERATREKEPRRTEEARRTTLRYPRMVIEILSGTQITPPLANAVMVTVRVGRTDVKTLGTSAMIGVQSCATRHDEMLHPKRT